MAAAAPDHSGIDVAIIGAGPAGLMAAAVLAACSSKKVVVFDKGEEIDRRERGVHGNGWVEGIGGAGLFSDGKLCMSLDVGGHLREELAAPEKARLLAILDAFFSRTIGSVPVSMESSVTDRVFSFGTEVSVTTYPVLHIGTDRGEAVIRTLVDAISDLGVKVRSHHELTDVTRSSDGGWRLSFDTPSGQVPVFECETMILAMGKVGAGLQSTLCERFGASVTSVPMYIGVRLECDAAALEPLFVNARDPKIKLHFPDGTKVKTHCATIEGEIATLHYEGLPLAGGHSYTVRRTGRSGFAILWDGIRQSDNFPYAQQLMQNISRATRGKLMVQLLNDYRLGRPSRYEDVRLAQPSLSDWGMGNIREFLPPPYTEKLDAFLRVLETETPQLFEANGLLAAPAIEWWMRRVVADSHSMRSGAGIYVCGDGSGWSQGIIHAAATAIIASEDILGTRVLPEQLIERVFRRNPSALAV
jgi:uncharacterized protein